LISQQIPSLSLVLEVHSCRNIIDLKIISEGWLITFFLIASLLRTCHNAQDCARNKSQSNLSGRPARLERIWWNCAKLAGCQLHPINWRNTLQANTTSEQEKKICDASSGKPQRAHEPLEWPCLIAICSLLAPLDVLLLQGALRARAVLLDHPIDARVAPVVGFILNSSDEDQMVARYREIERARGLAARH
jgi:hypothetical protein